MANMETMVLEDLEDHLESKAIQELKENLVTRLVNIEWKSAKP